MKACVYSLEAPIRDYFVHAPPAVTGEWTKLPSDISGAVVSKTVRSGKTDCGTFASMLDGRDYWSNPVQIEVLNPGNAENLLVRISSYGPNGKQGSGDDIIVESIRPSGK